MKKILFSLLLFSLAFQAFSQDVVSGTVMNAANDKPIEKVHIVNLNQVKGAVSEEDGSFELQATVNDTLYFSYLGFRSIKVRVTNDWLKYGSVKVKMTELGIALEEVVLKPVTLTGYLEIDARNIPIYENNRYSISGLNAGYEAGDNSASAISRNLGAIFNPADLMHNIFGKKPKQMRKLRQMKEDDEIRNLLRNKFDRETLIALLPLNEVELNEILQRCSYSKDFLKTANDLQILDALNGCYEEYKVLKRN
ncbi:carboxypeptidase-like regulatory domain-containing protein [Salegentibacter maritimus]|uniref:carboxypeptidase-like regulatory domain-containing protein n=1 Tax=Salegentibacter maritimus TaxID=2794347 RepID=UPI0018E48DF5|nr:carboxypeptidase-like regulatory domain-containing protein [Salegentibacter maritimus]MBI6115290.1 carboxypeptidase-like regulatory domain-containing protein [Salegentibacter maritimus]